MSSTRREFLKNASLVASSVGLASSVDAQTLKRSGFVSPLTASDAPYHPHHPTDVGIRERRMLAPAPASANGEWRLLPRVDPFTVPVGEGVALSLTAPNNSRTIGAKRGDREALAKRSLSHSTTDAMSVLINSGTRGNTWFAVTLVSTAGDSAFLSISTLFGKRPGNVNGNRLDEASLRGSVRSEETLAKRSPELPAATPELEPPQYADSLGWSRATASLDPARRSGATREIGEAARAAGLVEVRNVKTVAWAAGFDPVAFEPGRHHVLERTVIGNLVQSLGLSIHVRAAGEKGRKRTQVAASEESSRR